MSEQEDKGLYVSRVYFAIFLLAFLILAMILSLDEHATRKGPAPFEQLQAEQTHIEQMKQELLACKGGELLVFADGHVEFLEQVSERVAVVYRSVGGRREEIIFSVSHEWLESVGRSPVSPNDLSYPALAKRFLLQ